MAYSLIFSHLHVFVKLSVGGSRIGMLFDASLQAGKRARNPNILPEVKDLKPYGNTPNYPADLSNRAALVSSPSVYFLLCFYYLSDRVTFRLFEKKLWNRLLRRLYRNSLQ